MIGDTLDALLKAAPIIGFAINLIALLGIYNKLAIMTYQHRLMWADFTARKKLNDEQGGNK